MLSASAPSAFHGGGPGNTKSPLQLCYAKTSARHGKHSIGPAVIIIAVVVVFGEWGRGLGGSAVGWLSLVSVLLRRRCNLGPQGRTARRPWEDYCLPGGGSHSHSKEDGAGRGGVLGTGAENQLIYLRNITGAAAG